MKAKKGAKSRSKEYAISKTASLCPECLKTLPAEVFERDGKVWIRKHCAKHGEVEDLYWSDFALYKKAERFAHDGKGVQNPNVEKTAVTCPQDCGLCRLHKSHTALANIAVTTRCDLRCWYCLPYDEEVLIKLKGKTKFVKMGDLVECELKKGQKTIGCGVFTVPDNLEVLSFENGRTVWARVNKVLKRYYSGDFIDIRTKSGKSIRTTNDHRFMFLENGQLARRNIGIEDIGKDSLSILKIPSPAPSTCIDLVKEFRNIPEEESSKIYVHEVGDIFDHLEKSAGSLKNAFERLGKNEETFYSWRKGGFLPMNLFYGAIDMTGFSPNGVSFGVDAKEYRVPRFFEVTADMAKLMGYFISDGHYAKQNLWITCKDEYVRNDIKSILGRVGINYSVLEYKKQNKAPQIVIGNKILQLIFRHILKIPSGAGNKRLPEQVFDFSDDIKCSLLSGLFNGDGYIVRGESHLSLGLGTVSQRLANDTVYLLHSMGIFSRIHRASMRNNKLSNYDEIFKVYIASDHMLKLLEMIELKPSHIRRMGKIGTRKKCVFNGYEDFVIDKITKVDIIKSSNVQPVYDLEIDSDSHCFVAGNGILVSNCFYYSEKLGYVYEPSLEQIREMVRGLRNERPVPCNALQITGGEPMLRKDIVEIVRICKEGGIDHVQLNTNGIIYSKSPELAKELREAGINTLYLSFDGVTPKTNPKNHWEIPGVLQRCREAGTGIVLVPTVIKGINDHEIGDIVRFGFQNNDIVRGVNLQPVSLVGRITHAGRAKMRITIPDVLERLEQQTDNQIGREDFYPVPTLANFTRFVEALVKKPQYDLSSHFSCGMATYVFRDEHGRMLPITRFVDVEGLLEYLGGMAEELEKGKSKYVVGLKMLRGMAGFIDKKKAPKGFSIPKIIYNALMRHDYRALGAFHHKSLFIGMMHFMDLFNYDIERVKRCCIHYAMTDGRIIPFCAFNVIPEWYRDVSQRSQGMPISEWEKRAGGKLADEVYKRDIPLLESTELYKDTYRGFVKGL